MRINILEGAKIFDQAGTLLGLLDLKEGCRSEPMIIVESAEFSDLREVPITEDDQTAVSAGRNPGILLALDGRFQHADLHNANKRIYPDTLWDKLLKADGKWMRRVNENKMLGECDHPKDGQTLLSRVSHLVTSLHRNTSNPKEIRGRMVVFDTPGGRILKAIHEGGGKIGVSSRGKGSVVRRDGSDIVQEDFDLDTFDAVNNPSTPDAYPSVVHESTQDDGQENTEMNKRLQEITERLARFQKKDVSKLAGAAVDVISEEVESITSVLTTESFGEDAPKAAVLAVDAKAFERDLKSRKKQLTEEADDILGDAGKTVIPGGTGGDPKKNWMGLSKDTKETADGKAADPAPKVESVTRPTVHEGILSALEALTPANLRFEAETDIAKACSADYRIAFGVEGKLTEAEAKAITEHSKKLHTQRAKLEEVAKAPLKGKITINGIVEEITAPSEAELRRLAEGRIEGRNKGVAYIEIDRSDSIIRECADRFNLLLESQTSKALVAAQEATKVKAQLSEVSVKITAAQQIIEALVARVKKAEEGLAEAKADFTAAIEVLEAVTDEFQTERLRGTVAGIAATNPNVADLPRKLSEATTPEHAVQIAKTLIESSSAVVRESLPGREDKVSTALDLNESVAEERRRAESKPLTLPKTSSLDGAMGDRTKLIINRMKTLGGV